MATAVFLLIPESFHAFEMAGESHVDHAGEDHQDHSHRFLGGDDHHDESFVWKFGTCALAGFFFPSVVSSLSGHSHHEPQDASSTNKSNAASSSDPTNTQGKDCGLDECSICDDADVQEDYQENQEYTQEAIVTMEKNWSFAMTILVGDSLCNFVDGIFIGTAFQLCDLTVAYTIVASTIYHELAQEIADFCLLTQECGFTQLQAVLSNFCAGGAVLLGAIVVITLNVSHAAIGGILAFSAGVYLYLCGAEILPKIQANDKMETLAYFTMVVLGAMPIGLVLINHEHCEG